MDIFGNPADSGGFKNPANEVLNMNDYKIINLDTPTDNKDAANKIYVDTAVGTGGLPPGTSYSDYIYWDNSTSSYKSGNVKVHIGSASGAANQADYATAIGYNSGNQNQASNAVAVGNGAGNENQQNGATAVGAISGLQNQGIYATAVGYQSGFQNQGNGSVGVGHNSAYQNQGINSIAIGVSAADQSQGNYAIALGFQAGQVSQPEYSIAIGQNTNCTLQHEVVLGDSLCPQVKSAGMFVTDQGFKLSSGGSSTQYWTTDGSFGSPSSSGSSNIYLYNSSTDTNLITINNGQIRYNNSVQPSATQICISHLTRDGIDIDPFLELVAINNIIYIQDQSTSANYIKYKVVGPPSVVPNSYYIFTVLHLDSAGTGATNFPNGHNIFMSIYTDTATIDARLNTLDSQVLDLQNDKVSKSGDTMTGNLILQHDLYVNSRMMNGCIHANSNSIAISATGILLTSNITGLGGSNVAVTQSNTSVLNKIIKVNQAPTTVSAYSDSGYLSTNTFYRGSAGLYVGMGWTYNICFGIGDTNSAPSGGVCGMQVGFVASSTAIGWSAAITPDNTPNWFGVGHNYSDSVLYFYNKGTGGVGTKTATSYGVSTPSSLYFSLTMINKFGSNDILLVLKEIISNTSITQNYTMSGTNSVSNTTRLFPVFTRMYGGTAPSGGAIMSFSSMSLTA